MSSIIVATLVAGSLFAGSSWVDGYSEDSSIYVEAGDFVTVPATQHGGIGASSYVYERHAPIYCGTLDSSSIGTPCVDDALSGESVRTCGDGSTALSPLYRRPVDPSTGFYTGPWEPTSDVGGCPEDPAVAITVSAEDFRRLPLAASVPSIQPADGQALLGVPLVLHTDATPQELTTTVLGTTVRVRATPTSYTWDPGDGSAPIITTDPGAPYPQQTVTHTYTRPGEHSLTLQTSWSGQFQVPGGSWLPITGTATTVSPALTITVHEARSVLVADPLP